jgi:hypothetical protein
MAKYIIDTQTGTMVSTEYCYIVDDSDISEDLNPMSDRELSELAQNVGVRLSTIAQDTGWGDNAYRYTVSYSPLSIKDEAYSLIDGGVYEEGDPEHEALMWASTADPKDLERVSNAIMSQDSVWDGFRENLTEMLTFVHKLLNEEK